MSDTGQSGPWGQRPLAALVAEAERRADARAGSSVPAAGGRATLGTAPTPVTFTGAGGDLFGLLARGFLLLVVTLGLYRFWLMTELRRYYWSHSHVGDEAFAYRGTGMELFKGFLIALAIILPLKAASFVIVLSAPHAEWIVSIGLVVIYLFLGQFAVYAGRRYRLSRTSFRGLRFRMTGSAVAYAWKGFLWSLVVVATLGLAYPFAAAHLERLKMGETWFGAAKGDFDGSAVVLLKRGIVFWALGVALPLFLLTGAGLQLSAADWRGLLDLEAIDETLFSMATRVALVIASLASLAFLGPILVFPAFSAIVFRWRMEGMSLNGARLACNFTIGRAYRVYGLGVLALFGVAAAMFMTVALVMLLGAAGGAVAIAIAGIAAYLAIFGGLWIAKQLLIDLRLWRAQAASLAVLHLERLDDAIARNEDASALGEGLDGAVDLGVGL